MMPISSIRGPINAVAFPALSRLSHDPASFRTYYLKTTAIIATLSMPMAAFFFVSSAPLIELLLGPKWSNVTSIFSYLAIAALIQPAAGFSGSMLLSLGKSRLYVKCGIFNALIISIAFLIGIPWGEHGVGVAIAYAVANYVVLFPWLYWAHRNGPVTMTAFIQSFSLPFVAALAAILPAWIAFQYTPSLAPITRLPLMAIAYFPSYIAILGLTPHGRSLLETITRLVTSVFTRSTHR
jgi:PST family polysaccharide transporter